MKQLFVNFWYYIQSKLYKLVSHGTCQFWPPYGAGCLMYGSGEKIFKDLAILLGVWSKFDLELKVTVPLKPNQLCKHSSKVV
jgi:hypothetical protein